MHIHKDKCLNINGKLMGVWLCVCVCLCKPLFIHLLNLKTWYTVYMCTVYCSRCTLFWLGLSMLAAGHWLSPREFVNVLTLKDIVLLWHTVEGWVGLKRESSVACLGLSHRSGTRQNFAVTWPWRTQIQVLPINLALAIRSKAGIWDLDRVALSPKLRFGTGPKRP